MKKKKKKHKNRNLAPIFMILALIAAICGVLFAACGGKSETESENSEISANESGEAASGNTSESILSTDTSADVSADISEDVSNSGESTESTEDVSKDGSEDTSGSIDVDLDGEKFSYINWYKAENSNRYALYEMKNPDFTDEQIVTYVNMGLDNPYYTNTYKADANDGIFILVNKYSYVDRNFTPANLVTLSSECSAKNGVQLVKEAADAFAKLSADAKALEYSILGMSGYRTYSYQESLYNRYLKNDTQANVDKYSARPGHSEHHTGLALDVQAGNGYFADFGQSKEYEWLLDNAHKYGYVIHYTEYNQWITGYMPEEWHIRYLGVEAATYIYDNNLSVDEYLIMFGSESPSEKYPESEEDSYEPIEEPSSDVTSSEEPSSDVIASEEPSSDVIASEEPSSDVIASEEPSSDVTSSEEPSSDVTSSEEPSSDVIASEADYMDEDQ